MMLDAVYSNSIHTEVFCILKDNKLSTCAFVLRI